MARQFGKILTAQVVTVFAVAWLSLAMQPCMAAMEPITPADQHGDCPHCPEVIEQECLDGVPIQATLTPTQSEQDSELLPDVAVGSVGVTLRDMPTVAIYRHRPPVTTGPPLTIRYCCFRE